jgi:hypothetical protein
MLPGMGKARPPHHSSVVPARSAGEKGSKSSKGQQPASRAATSRAIACTRCWVFAPTRGPDHTSLKLCEQTCNVHHATHEQRIDTHIKGYHTYPETPFSLEYYKHPPSGRGPEQGRVRRHSARGNGVPDGLGEVKLLLAAGVRPRSSLPISDRTRGGHNVHGDGE